MKQPLRFALVTGVAALLTAGCGEGRAIFNVDVYSFLAGEIDTLPYSAPPIIGTYDTTSSPVEISLFSGLGDSNVDSVYITGSADLINTSGNASIRLEMYFAADAGSVYSGTPQFVTTGTVNGAETVPIGASVVLTDSLFSEPRLWVGIRLQITNNAAAFLNGRAAINGVDARIVLNDQVF
jgi:hypothetical protein